VIQILLDDNVFFERQNNNELPYDNPHYILLNIAMGGNLGLLPGTEIPESFNDAIMEIDYVRVYQQSPLSLNASGQISKASISPNPAQNMVKVSLNSNELIKNIQLFDVTGKLILNQNNINKSSTNLYVSDLNSGLYIVVIKTNKTVITKRLVVQ
jgi:beta-glucanase (GH16 family)